MRVTRCDCSRIMRGVGFRALSICYSVILFVFSHLLSLSPRLVVLQHCTFRGNVSL